jgi:competence protein ComEA
MHRLLLALALVGPMARAQSLPDGPGKDAFASVCTQCHGLDIITPLKRTAAEWKTTVAEMKAKGASATDQEFDAIAGYLAKNFAASADSPKTDASAVPASSTSAASKPAASTPASLPDGPGKQFILTQCTACHLPDQFTKYHHTPVEWQAIITRMGTRVSSATKQDLDQVLQYFVTNYPKIEAPDDPNKVNMNKSSAQEIATRLDLTEAEAEAIVHYRETHGDFKEWKDMLIIYGVNGKKIRDRQGKMAF